MAQRSLARSLTLIRLKRKLSNRPSIPSLIERGVLPAPYYHKSADDTAIWQPVRISPVLLGTAKELEKQRVKDMLRGWVGNKRPSLADAERVGWIEKTYLEEERPKVREMATRFTKRCIGGSQRQNSRWGKGRVLRNDPPRAHVLGLRAYYERLASAVWFLLLHLGYFICFLISRCLALSLSSFVFILQERLLALLYCIPYLLYFMMYLSVIFLFLIRMVQWLYFGSLCLDAWKHE